MSKNLQNIDDAFRQAFDQWEAPHSNGEMQADWNQLSKHIPQAPAPQSPAAGTQAGSGLGKLAAWAAGTGAAITAGAVLIYNIYVKEPQPKAAAQQNESRTESVENQAPSAISQQQQLPSGETGPTSAQTPVAVAAKPSQPAHKKHGKQHTAASAQSTAAAAASSSVHNNNSNNGNDPSGQSAVPAAASSGTIKTGKEAQKSLLASRVNLPVTTVCIGQPALLTADMHDMEAGSINWGDGESQVMAAGNTHVYETAGLYKLIIAAGSETVEKTIKVESQPEARFSYAMGENLKVKFRNLTEAAGASQWNFGDGSGFQSTNEHTYNDTGRYLVRLAVRNNAGCADTNIQWVRVSQKLVPQTYNIITPNGDNKNDELILDVPNAIYYHLTIVDQRLGRMVFESFSAERRWAGTDMGGNWLPNGNYFYVLEYRTPGDDKTQQLTGSVALER